PSPLRVPGSPLHVERVAPFRMQENRPMRITSNLTAACLLALSASALAAEPSETPLAYQLAATPLALVNGDRCEVRGAVWVGKADGMPKPGVNINLELPDGSIVKAKTNESGIYTASIPYAGSTLEIREHIADPVSVPTALKDEARIHSPVMVCSQERTQLFLQALSNFKTGREF